MPDPVYWISFLDTGLVESAPLGDAGATGYVDYLGPLGGPVDGALPPDATQAHPWTVTFDAALSQGLGEYVIDPGVGFPAQNTGTVIIHYLVFDADPLFGGVQIGSTQQLFLPGDPSPGSDAPGFTINVVNPADVPEPTTVLLAGLGLILLGLRRHFAKATD
jgi:hypothetical protein